MRLMVRVSFRQHEIEGRSWSVALHKTLHRNGTKPFWIGFEEDTFREIAAYSPRVLQSAHLTKMEMSAPELKRVKYFEPRAKRLLKVTDEDFASWDRFRLSYPWKISPDGYRVTYPDRLALTGVSLKLGEFGCPESGEYCFVASNRTLEMLAERGLSGFVASEVIHGGAKDLRIMQAERIVTAGSSSLAFGEILDDRGCRRLDRPSLLVVKSENEIGADDAVLLPESRDSSSGTLIVSAKFVEVFSASGCTGLKFEPVLVFGDELWQVANAEWNRFRNIL